jgi:hypothetical protein
MKLIKSHVVIWLIGGFLSLNCSVYAEPTPIPSFFDKNAVQFIFIRTADTNFVPDGTCFTVEVKQFHFPHIFIPLPFIGKPTLYYDARYIVTAKHVLYDESGNLRHNMYLRVGTRKGGISYMSLSDEIVNGAIRIITPKNNDADLAVLAGKIPTTNELASALVKSVPLPPDISGTLKFGSFSSSLVLDENSFNANGITEGYEMFFVGLFTPFYGANENLRIFRFGHLAMLPDEPIPMGGQGRRNLLLMETEAFPGNSGSPAFFTAKKDILNLILSNILSKHPSNNKIIFAGVVDAYFKDFSEVMMVDASHRAISSSNTGIAAIVPAKYLHDILFSQQEAEVRTLQFKLYKPSGYF